MWTALSIETRIWDHQPFHNRVARNVLIDDLIYVRHCDPAIPNRLRINHHRWPMLALVQASGLVGSDLAFQPALCQSGLERLMQFSAASWIA